VKLGIDFGTTRIVVAAADRGNYPLVSFDTPDGDARDWYPSVVAVAGERRAYGWEAVEMHGKPGWTLVRSLKRELKTAGPFTEIEVAGQHLNLSMLITEMLSALRRDLIQRSTLNADESTKLQVMLGVPANANSNQRFLTEEAARAAGFEVLGLANEPSAAAVEFAQGAADRRSRDDASLLVYDLGGGTFDASLVALCDNEHAVLAADGISDLGGDDFDEILAELALKTAKIREAERDSFADAERFVLLEECREKKEALNPNSRRVSVDLGRVRETWKEVSIPVDEFYELCRPLVEGSRAVVENLIASCPEISVDTLYVTGGGSELPPVARILREGFGRKVKRSSYMRSATAIGLAIRADEHEGAILRERFAQNFGVWREADHGQNVVFDVMFPRGSKLPARGQEPLRVVRTYRPVHNVGHFRYLECSRLDTANQPYGEITDWDEIRVPFDPQLRGSETLLLHPERRFAPGEGPLFEEEYTCDSSGQLKVRISDMSGGYVQEFRLGQWSKNGASPAKKRAKRGR
jgi:molecular chaperone DnaK (HSP70)